MNRKEKYMMMGAMLAAGAITVAIALMMRSNPVEAPAPPQPAEIALPAEATAPPQPAEIAPPQPAETSLPAEVTVLPQPDDVTLGVPIYGGSGCPRGTARAVLSPDRRTLTVLFDQYAALAPRGETFDYRSCNFAVPINVPSGWAVSLIRADYRGFVRLPANAKGTFSAEYFFAGDVGPILSRTFRGPMSRNVLIDQEVLAITWSECGRSVTARVNSNARVEKARARDPDAAVIVDTADIQAGLVFNLGWQRC